MCERKNGRMNEVSSRERKKKKRQHKTKTSESESINLVRSLKISRLSVSVRGADVCASGVRIVSKVESDANVRVGGLVRQWALPHRSPE